MVVEEIIRKAADNFAIVDLFISPESLHLLALSQSLGEIGSHSSCKVSCRLITWLRLHSLSQSMNCLTNSLDHNGIRPCAVN